LDYDAARTKDELADVLASIKPMEIVESNVVGF